ncbi:MAG: hypothetical protein HRF46_13575, partial [Acidobacteriota bacterium]
RWVGDGLVVSIDRFGASAPGDEVARRLGFSPEELERRVRQALAERRPCPVHADVPSTLAGAVAGKHARLLSLHAFPRIGCRDASLWAKAAPREPGNSLGWLDLPARTRVQLPALRALVAKLAANGVDTLHVIGLGPAALAPWALRHTCGNPSGRQLEVVDTLEPGRITTLLEGLSARRSALLVIASANGGEDETLALLDLFWEPLARTLRDSAGSRVLAIGDHGSRLERVAMDRGFAGFLPHPSDTAPHFAAHGPAAMLAAAWLGLDVDRLLTTAERVLNLSPEHPAVELATLLAGVAEPGWGRLAWCPSHDLRPLGVWVEQLFAHATGKEGRGIVPIFPAQLPAPAAAWPHTLFLSPRFADEAATALDAGLAALAAAGHPVVRWPLRRRDLGGALATLEMAAALTALLLGVNPFEEPPPNRRGRRASPQSRQLGSTPAPARWDTLRDFFAARQSMTSVVILAYLPERFEVWQALAAVASRVEHQAGVPVSFGFAPRATLALGKLLTRGPAGVASLILTCDLADEVVIPGRSLALGALMDAQAREFAHSCAHGGRNLLHLHLGEDPLAALNQLLM